jgi:hypothetical protein
MYSFIRSLTTFFAFFCYYFYFCSFNFSKFFSWLSIIGLGSDSLIVLLDFRGGKLFSTFFYTWITFICFNFLSCCLGTFNNVLLSVASLSVLYSYFLCYYGVCSTFDSYCLDAYLCSSCLCSTFISYSYLLSFDSSS